MSGLEPGATVAYGVKHGPHRAVHEFAPGPPRPQLLDRVRERYIFFHGKRHPAEMGAAEVAAFLTALARRDHVAASTQDQALSALLFR
jgi:Phage integrase, N-terminal SAM-like domain